MTAPTHSPPHLTRLQRNKQELLTEELLLLLLLLQAQLTSVLDLNTQHVISTVRGRSVKQDKRVVCKDPELPEEKTPGAVNRREVRWIYLHSCLSAWLQQWSVIASFILKVSSLCVLFCFTLPVLVCFLPFKKHLFPGPVFLSSSFIVNVPAFVSSVSALCNSFLLLFHFTVFPCSFYSPLPVLSDSLRESQSIINSQQICGFVGLNICGNIWDNVST